MSEDYRDDLDVVEDYWIRRLELVTTLKECAAIPIARAFDDNDDDHDNDKDFAVEMQHARHDFW